MHGSVIRSWLIELMGNALREYGDFAKLSTYVEDTGEVKWVVNWANDRDLPIPCISLSQTVLMQYRDVDWPQAKAHALLRNQYGGHPIHKALEAPPGPG
jgi:6-phosphogluconate dehydrogenase